MTTTHPTSPERPRRRTAVARVITLIRYLVEDAIGIIADVRYEIRDRLRGRRRRRSGFRRFPIVLAACVIGAGSLRSQVATPAIVGHWKGEAEIFSNWTKARTLAVDIRIAANDSVTGTIGDARLTGGTLFSNRGWLGRTLAIKTDYRIVGGLAGKVIEAEGIERSSVSLPLNLVDGTFRGSVQTSGAKVGGGASAILTAGRLVLRRVPDTMLCQRQAMPCPGGPMMSGKPARTTR
jgi:outer membrane lipoprotein SlyB